MHARSKALWLCVVALCLTSALSDQFTVRALSKDEVAPGSFEPQYADEKELQQLKQERDQQMQEEAQSSAGPATQQSSSNVVVAESSSTPSSSPQSHPALQKDSASNTAFLLKDVIIHDSTMETKSPSLIEFEPLTPAEAMFYPYIKAQVEGEQLEAESQILQTPKRKSFSSRFMQVRGPASESAGAPYSSYAAVVEGSAPGFGSFRGTPLGTFRPLVNLYSDGTPYPLDMRKFDHFQSEGAVASVASASASSSSAAPS